MSADESVLRRVTKLLAKAEDSGVTPEEAEALSTKAAEMLAKYGLDRAILAASQPQTDVMTSKKIPCPPPYAEAKYTLLIRVAKPMRVDTILLKTKSYDGKNRNYYTVHLIGFTSDIERADLLYTSLQIQAFNALQYVATSSRGMRKSADRDSWMDGFSTAVNRRLEELEGTAVKQSTTPGVGIVLMDRDALVKAETARLYPNSTMGRGRSLSGRARSQGYAAGMAADLGRTGRVGSTSRRPLG